MIEASNSLLASYGPAIQDPNRPPTGFVAKRAGDINDGEELFLGQKRWGSLGLKGL